jgi:hypothetical protein
MRLTSGHFKHLPKLHVGPGGCFCRCCTKLPINELKIMARRMERRKSKQMDFQNS